MVDPSKTAAPTEESGLGRRRFLTYMVAAPTLTVGARLALDSDTAASAQSLLPPVPSPPQAAAVVDFGDAVVNASALTAHLMVLKVSQDNRAVFELPRTEVGQGIATTIGMVIAEELDMPLKSVVVQLSPSRPELMFNQFTASSTSVRSLWKPVRAMAAAARSQLVTAAAKRWNVPANTLTTSGAKVSAPDGRSATFGELTTDAAKVSVSVVPANPKPASRYTLIGKPTARTDARDIVTGKVKYAFDQTIPGALPTVVARPPTLGGTVGSVDDSAARAMPGVVAITKIPTGVAVSAKTFWEAMKAKDALKITWKTGPDDALSDSDIQAKLADKAQGFLSPGGLGKTVDASFDFAFVSHAPMEVLNAVADVKPGRADVWCPAQTPIVAAGEIAKELNLPKNSVTVHVTRAGGSFGRWLFFDAALEAARISQAIGKPVKLMWTRNDDMRHGRMRPASHHKIRATYALNNVLSFEHRMAGVEVDLRHGMGEMLTAGGAQVGHRAAGQLYFDLSETVPYNFGGSSLSLAEIPMDIPTGSWRSVHSATFRTAEEIVIDELARQMGQNPVEFRMRFLKTQTAKNVLRKVADAGRWGRAMPAGSAQGVAYHEEHRSSVACLVEINATNRAQPRVTKAVMAVDVGRAINPTGLRAQLSGGLHDGISTVLQAGLHIDKGAVREGSFSDFRWAKQRHSPLELELYVMPATGEPGGAGELGVPVAAAAVANAYARATGTQPRRFPINF